MCSNTTLSRRLHAYEPSLNKVEFGVWASIMMTSETQTCDVQGVSKEGQRCWEGLYSQSLTGSTSGTSETGISPFLLSDHLEQA